MLDALDEFPFSGSYQELVSRAMISRLFDSPLRGIPCFQMQSLFMTPRTKLSSIFIADDSEMKAGIDVWWCAVEASVASCTYTARDCVHELRQLADARRV